VWLSIVLLPVTAGVAQVESPWELTLGVDSGQISLRVCGEPLRRVLALVEKESGISFGVAGSVGKEQICGHVQGETWRQLMETLLEGYNKAVVYNDDGTVLRVLVLNHGVTSPQVAVETPIPPVEGVPDAVPPPTLLAEGAAGRSEATPLPASPPGGPPNVPAPVDPSAKGGDEQATSSALLRGFVAPGDLADMKNPPVDEFAAADEMPSANLGQGGEMAEENLPLALSPPPEPNPPEPNR
jgi:hypothetical protein